MKLLKEDCSYYTRLTQEKIVKFQKMFPNVNIDWDDYGRGPLGTLPGCTEDKVERELLTKDNIPTQAYRESIEEYCKRENISDINYDSIKSVVENLYIFNTKDYSTNLVMVTKEFKEGQEQKLTSILSHAHKIWLDKMPTYKRLKAEISNLRSQGLTYEDERLVKLTEDRKKFEKGNMFVAYDQFLNSIAKSKLMISLNPLDKLTASGGNNGNDNPTAFKSCWSLKACKCDDYVEFLPCGIYSNPKAQLALGSSALSCTVFIDNGRRLQFPGTDFFWYGYAERANGWFDKDGIFIERMYPSTSECRLQDVCKVLKKAGFNIIPSWDDKTEMRTFDTQIEGSVVEDYHEAASRSTSLFLDRVAIVDGMLYRFPVPRVKYRPWDTSDAEPWHSMAPGYSEDNYEEDFEDD